MRTCLHTSVGGDVPFLNVSLHLCGYDMLSLRLKEGLLDDIMLIMSLFEAEKSFREVQMAMCLLRLCWAAGGGGGGIHF